MKIVHVINSLAHGGAEHLVVDMSFEAIEQGHTVSVIVLGNRIQCDTIKNGKQLKVYSLNFSGTIYQMTQVYQVFNKLREALIELNPDIIHTHSFLPDILTKLAIKHGSPIVTTYHTPEPFWKRETYKQLLKAELEGLFARKYTNAHVAVSLETAKAAQAALKLSELPAYIQNGIDTEKFVFVERSPTDSANEIRIIQVGRFYQEKAQDISLEALAILKQKGLSPRLSLVGDGPLNGRLFSLAKQLEITENIDHTPATNDVFAHLKQADIFWLPSRREGLPIALLEAMSTGIAVIASPVGEIPNVIRHNENGLILNRITPQDLADATISLIKAPSKRAQLSRSASNFIKQYFSIEATSNHYLGLYHSLVK